MYENYIVEDRQRQALLEGVTPKSANA